MEKKNYLEKLKFLDLKTLSLPILAATILSEQVTIKKYTTCKRYIYND